MSDAINSPAQTVTAQPTAPTSTPTPPRSRGDAIAPSVQSQTAAPAAPRRIRVGEIDLPEEEVIRGYTRAQEARKLAEEASVSRQQALHIIETLKTDPMSLITDPRFGLSEEQATEMVEKFLLKEIEKEKLTPEQRRIKELESRLQAREEAERKVREAAEQEQLSRENAQYLAKVSAEFREAMGKYDLPLTTETMRRMAHVKLVALSRDIELDAADVAAEVAASYEGEHLGIFKNLEGESLLRRLGPDLLKKINEAQVRQYKGRAMGASNQPKPSTEIAPGVDPNRKDDAYWKFIRDFTR